MVYTMAKPTMRESQTFIHQRRQCFQLKMLVNKMCWSIT